MRMLNAADCPIVWNGDIYKWKLSLELKCEWGHFLHISYTNLGVRDRSDAWRRAAQT